MDVSTHPTPEMKQEVIAFVQEALEGANVRGYALIAVVNNGSGLTLETISGGWLPPVETMQSLARGAAGIGEDLGVRVHLQEAVQCADGSLKKLH